MSPDPQWKAQLQGFHELQGKIGLKVGLPSPFSGFFFKFSEHTTSSNHKQKLSIEVPLYQSN
jgi:hypothetical protein